MLNTKSEVHVKNFMLVKAREEDWLLSDDELIQKYSFVNITKSTVSSIRLKSIGENKFDGFDLSTFDIREFSEQPTSDAEKLTIPSTVNAKGYLYKKQLIPVNENEKWHLKGNMVGATDRYLIQLLDSNYNIIKYGLNGIYITYYKVLWSRRSYNITSKLNG